MERAKVLVVGSSITDMVVSVLMIPAGGETVTGGELRIFQGGKGCNQAVAAARAGGDIELICAVGDDSFGLQSVELLSKSGIAAGDIVKKQGVSSGVALITADSEGERSVAVAPGANALLTAEDLSARREAFSRARLMIAQLEIPLVTVYRAVHLAKEAGSLIMLNPAPMPPDGLADDLLRDIDFLTPSEAGVLRLAPEGKTVEEAAQRVLARGPRAVIVTRGMRGVTVCTADGITDIPAHPVSPVDVVGAEDAFTGALGTALAGGRDLSDAVRFAVVAAGLSTTVIGAQEGMPMKKEIERQLHSSDGL